MGQEESGAWRLGPVTRFQRLHLERCPEGNSAHNGVIRWRLLGELDTVAVKLAVEDLIDRHESLRVGFRRVEDRIVQLIAPTVALDIHRVDLSRRRAADRERALATMAGEQVKEPFDLSRPGLLRVTLIRCAPSHHVLMLAVHHSIWDGWSSAVALRDFSALYATRVGEPSPALPQLPLEISDLVAWDQRPMSTASRRYWRSALQDYTPELPLPLDSFDGRRKPYLQGKHDFELLSAAAGRALARISNELNATLAMSLVGLFGAWLGALTGEAEVIVATNNANRLAPESHDLVGCLLDFKLIPIGIRRGVKIRDVIVDSRTAVTAAIEHRATLDQQLAEHQSLPCVPGPCIHDVWINYFPDAGPFASAQGSATSGSLEIISMEFVGWSDCNWNDGSLGLTLRPGSAGSVSATAIFNRQVFTGASVTMLSSWFSRFLRWAAIRPGDTIERAVVLSRRRAAEQAYAAPARRGLRSGRRSAGRSVERA